MVCVLFVASQGLASDVEELMGEEEAAARKAQMRSKRMGTLSDKPQDMQVREKATYLSINGS